MSELSPIAAQVLKLKQDLNELSFCPLLTEIDHRFIDRLEKLSSSDSYAASVCKELRSNLPRDVQDTDRIRQFHNHLAEARVFYDLKGKGIDIRRVTGTGQRPDFEIVTSESNLFAEIKTLSMDGGNDKYRAIAEEGLHKKVDLDERLKQGERIAFAEQVIRPVGKGEAGSESSTTRQVIECLIDKLRSAIKTGQLRPRRTIMICDINQFSLGCTHEESVQSSFTDPATGTSGSGTLHHVALGEEGTIIYRPAEFAGPPATADGPLSQPGILHQFQNIAAIIFRCGWNPAEYLGVVRADADRDIVAVVEEICDHVGTESN